MDALHERFVACAGSVRGREHERALRNNQDAAFASVAGDVGVAIVCDGCSSGVSSEVGAQLAAAWLGAHLPAYARAGLRGRALVDAATRSLLETLGDLACRLSPEAAAIARTVHDHLLFAFLAAVITPDAAVVFGVGDGVVAIDDRVTVLDPGEDNAPRYLAYDLVAGAPLSSRATILFEGAIDSFRTIAIATDGAAELEARRDEPLRDGARQGGLVDLARDRRLSKNPSLLRKRLVVLSELNGRLSDDTSVAIVARKEEA